MTYNITSFIDWFFATLINMIWNLFGQIDSIILNDTYNISLLDFTIYIVIIGIVITIVINTTPTEGITRLATKGITEKQRLKEIKKAKGRKK